MEVNERMKSYRVRQRAAGLRLVQLWVPEVGGAIDPGSDAHEIVMSLYGGMSKGERNRIKIRVRSAMAAQAAITTYNHIDIHAAGTWINMMR